MQTVAKTQQNGLAGPPDKRVMELVVACLPAVVSFSTVDLASLLIEENPELFHEWLIHETARLISAQRRKLKRMLVMPLFPEWEEQFSHIPKRLPMPNGKRRVKGKATYRQFREFGKSLEKRYKNAPLRKEVDRILKIMHPYAQQTPGITYDQVARLEAENHGW